LALTGTTLGASDALALGLADHCLDEQRLAQAWDALTQIDPGNVADLAQWLLTFSVAINTGGVWAREQIDEYFSMNSVADIVRALEADASDGSRHTLKQLRQRSPLMLHVAFEQIRRARKLSLAEDLRMERDMMRHCFYPRHLAHSAGQTETAEGIRALVIDKDNTPMWNPARIEDVTPEMVLPFFDSPWAAHCHPLRALN